MYRTNALRIGKAFKNGSCVVCVLLILPWKIPVSDTNNESMCKRDILLQVE